MSSPRTTEEISEDVRVDSAALHRLLRALASVGIFAEDDRRRFALTPLAECLRSDSPENQRDFAVMLGSECYAAWGKLLHSVRTGEEAFQETWGVPIFEYLTKNPERGRIFDAAMTGIHGGETEPMLDAYDFSGFRRVVDVGGGNGLVLSAILNRHPRIEGVLFDLPEVVESARTTIVGTGLAERCQIEGGDFFRELPAGADAYLLRHIVHDWNDDAAVAILRNCREAMIPEGRVLVVETVIPLGNDPCFGKWLDLMMLVIGGKERTEDQYRTLLGEAGLELQRIVPTTAGISVIEAVRRDEKS